MMQVQEVDRVKAVEHLNVQSSGEAAAKCPRSGAAILAGKHVVLHRTAPRDCVATSPQHVVISWIGKASFDGMVTVLNGAIHMRGMGVG